MPAASNTILVLAVLFMLSTPTLFAQEDIIKVFEQNEISGRLVKIKKGVLYFDANQLGRLEVDLDDIDFIKAEERQYRIKTVDREFLHGHIRPKEDGESLIIFDEEDDEIEIEVRRLSDVKVIYSGIFRKVDADIGAGYSFTKSSEVGRFNTDFQLYYESFQFDLSLTGDFIFTQESLEDILPEDRPLEREREVVDLLGKYYLGATSFGFVLGRYQRSLELNLASRFQTGLGAGMKAFRTRQMEGEIRSGLVVNRETNLDGVTFNQLFEFPIFFNLEIFKLKQPDITFSTEQVFYAGLTQWGRYRLDGDTKIKWDAFGGLNLKLSFYSNIDSSPPAGFSSNFDYGLVFSLGYSF